MSNPGSRAEAANGDTKVEDPATMTILRRPSRSHDGAPIGAQRSSLPPFRAVQRRTILSGSCSGDNISAALSSSVTSPLLGPVGCTFLARSSPADPIHSPSTGTTAVPRASAQRSYRSCCARPIRAYSLCRSQHNRINLTNGAPITLSRQAAGCPESTCAYALFFIPQSQTGPKKCSCLRQQPPWHGALGRSRLADLLRCLYGSRREGREVSEGGKCGRNALQEFCPIGFRQRHPEIGPSGSGAGQRNRRGLQWPDQRWEGEGNRPRRTDPHARINRLPRSHHRRGGQVGDGIDPTPPAFLRGWCGLAEPRAKCF